MWFLSDWHSQLLKLFFLRSNASKTLWYSFLSRLAAKQTYIKSLLHMRREAPPKIWRFTIFPAIECTRIALLLYENLEKNLYQGQKIFQISKKGTEKGHFWEKRWFHHGILLGYCQLYPRYQIKIIETTFWNKSKQKFLENSII